MDIGGFGGGPLGFEFGRKIGESFLEKMSKKIRVRGSSGGGQKS